MGTSGTTSQAMTVVVLDSNAHTRIAFKGLWENVQNAVDAVRIQALREDADPADARYRIDVTADADRILVHDNGTGMSASDLQNYFWTIGASGKRTPEAEAAGCVGMFGIGGFANFGVCHTLEVISQTGDATHGTLTRLGETEIQSAGSAIPMVHAETSGRRSPAWDTCGGASAKAWQSRRVASLLTRLRQVCARSDLFQRSENFAGGFLDHRRSRKPRADHCWRAGMARRESRHHRRGQHGYRLRRRVDVPLGLFTQEGPVARAGDLVQHCQGVGKRFPWFHRR